MTQVVHVDPNAHRAWSQSLEELIRTDAAEETAQARLSEIAREVREHPSKVDWRRLDQKVRKVQLALRKAADPPEKFHYVSESQEEKAEREAELAALQAELAQTERWLDSRPGLAEACRQAALDEIGPCAVESLELSEYIGLRRGYSAERIQAIRPTGPAPESRDADRQVGAGITARTDNDHLAPTPLDLEETPGLNAFQLRAATDTTSRRAYLRHTLFASSTSRYTSSSSVARDRQFTWVRLALGHASQQTAPRSRTRSVPADHATGPRSGPGTGTR